MAEEKQNFEDSLQQLEKIVSEMESGSLSLDDMMQHYEQGRALAAACSAELDKIKQRIEQVTAKGVEPLTP